MVFNGWKVKERKTAINLAQHIDCNIIENKGVYGEILKAVTHKADLMCHQTLSIRLSM